METARRDERKRGAATWWPGGTCSGSGGFVKDGVEGWDGFRTIAGSIK